MATQGYKQVIYFEDPLTPGTFIDMSCYLNDGTLTLTQDPIDVTTFCTDGFKSNLPGLKSVSISIGFVIDKTLRTWLWNAFNAEQPFGVKHYPEGEGSGEQYYAFDGLLSNGTDGGAVAAALGGNGSITSSGAVTLETEA